MMLHLLNVALHATNAYLTGRLMQGWLHDMKGSLLAGLIMLTAPLAPEAVVWCSGVFDIVATTLVLLCVLLARRYDSHVSAATRIQFLVLGLAAVASKETAAVAGGFVIVDAWARRARCRQLLIDTSVLIGVVAVFSIVRLASVFGVSKPPFSKYLLQRALFGSVGGLMVPWHIEVIQGMPWLPIVGVSIVMCLASAFLVRFGSTERTRLAVAAAAWILLPIIPIWPIMFVAPNLEQSRYLYLPAVGWAALIVVLASEAQTYLKPFSMAAVLGLITIAAYGTILHLRPWKDAARLRDQVEASAFTVRVNTCRTMIVRNLPDSVKGAYVFRNGVHEAFERDLLIDASVAPDRNDPCVFQWNDDRGQFVRQGP
jgi:hypothetical protein